MSGTTERAPRSVQGDVPTIRSHDTVRKVLLTAGVLSSMLYVLATDVVAAAQWDNYSRAGEMVSKLFCRRVASKACAYRPGWRHLHRADDRFRLRRLGIGS
jgi:hypothetical protein